MAATIGLPNGKVKEYMPVVESAFWSATSILSPPISVCHALTLASIGVVVLLTTPLAIPLAEAVKVIGEVDGETAVIVLLVTCTPVTTSVASPEAVITRS